MLDDAELLRRYAEEKSEEAFAELVRRHIGLVYFSALRRVGGDHHLAADISQRVFVGLASHARALRRHPVLTGWLFTTTRNDAINVRIADERRRRREQEAAAMHETLGPESATDWEHLRPVIYESLDALPAPDRDAVLLRFFGGQPFAEIGRVLHVTEEAARKRVERALEKLHGSLVSRGINSTAAVMASVLGAEAALVPPAAVSGAIAAAVVAGGAPASLGFVATLAMNKAKAGAITALVLAGFVTTGFELHATRELRTELRALRGEADLERLERERRRLAGELAAVGNQPELDELTRLNQRIAALQARPPGLAHNLKPIGNPGRATPVEAFESFCWALNSRDLDVVASFISFTDDTPENRETFMARLGPVLREKYRTAERVCAAAFFPGIIVSNWPQDPAVALAVTEVRADGLGQIRVQATLRLASGKETESRDRFRRTTEGWLLASGELTDAKLQEFVASRLDPVTGESRAK